MENANSNVTIVTAQEGETLSIVGDTYRIVMTGEQTGGAYAAIDMLVPPGGGPGPHSHANFQESFLILDGEVEVKTETQIYTARKGTLVNIPLGGLVHCFKNVSDKTAHLWCVVVPAGLDAFFHEVGVPVAAGAFLPPPVLTAEDQKRLQSIAEKYGQKVFPPNYLDK